MEAPRCRLCGERHWAAVACRVEASPPPTVDIPEVHIDPPLPADPEPEPVQAKPKKKRKGRGKQNAAIRRRLHAVKEIEKLGGVNLKGVHCPTCTCRNKRLHATQATRQSAYRMRQRMLKAHREVAATPPPATPPAEPDPSCG